MVDPAAVEWCHCLTTISADGLDFSKIHEANRHRNYWGHNEEYPQADFTENDDVGCDCERALVPTSKF